jgi:glycosyltransferase involved in cell wall biosynthesis
MHPPTDIETMSGKQKHTMTLLRLFLAKILQLLRVLTGTRRHPFLSISSRAYERWIKKNIPSEQETAEFKKKSRNFTYKPIIGIVIPVYNTERLWLEKAIESVLNQLYEKWELCLVNDGSTEGHVRETLENFNKMDKRIKVKHLKRNQGIARASNEALAMAAGEYIAFMDSDDELHPLSLFEVAVLLNDRPDADVIYTDEDKLTLEGKRKRPIFKTDWSPELFLTYNYINHLTVCRKKLIDEVGGFRPEFNWSQDYDLYLRITEKSDRVFHIPKVLYHWRTIPDSSASKVDFRTEALEKSKQLLKETLCRRGIDGIVTEGLQPGTFKVKMKRVRR